jgi:hypothetical protein
MISLFTAAGLLAAAVLATAGPAAATTTTTWPSTLHAKHWLVRGQRLVSANGYYHAAVEADGRLVVRTYTGTQVWASPKTGANAYVYLASTGNFAVRVAGVSKWTSRTTGSGEWDVLTMRDDGVLALSAGGALVWGSTVMNECPSTGGKTFVVDISEQRGRMCNWGQQIRATWVTTGASAYGDGTPTGTWHVQARIRDTTLYPASGGAYPVHYWMPYNGAYGVHDSPWQHFAYGSSLYKTHGSHGCVHVPETMMAWLFGWAPVGTTVTIRS